MLGFLRPDAIEALEEPMIRRVLPRYVRVVKNKATANFLIAKHIEFKGRGNLWEVHSNLMKKFYETRERLDRGEIELENLSKSKPSLLDLKIKLTEEIMRSCELCERKCHVNRIKEEKGLCGVGNECLLSSEFIHMGEEAHVTPSHCLFFMGCNFRCQYCQNWSISQWYEQGYRIEPKELAIRIERRRKEGARNVNLVGGEPTPNLLWILKALKYCKTNVPIIWNSNFYMSEKTMQILEGIIDMYLSDFKYGNDECALRLSKVPNYFETCARNHSVAAEKAEVTIRHLILPNHIECCTKPVLKWIAENIGEKTIVNLMGQFRPEFKSNQYPEINRLISKREMKEAIALAKQLNLNFIT